MEFFMSLTLKNFFLVDREPRKNLGKMTKKGRQKFSKENVDICLVVREPRQNLSSGPRVGKG